MFTCGSFIRCVLWGNYVVEWGGSGKAPPLVFHVLRSCAIRARILLTSGAPYGILVSPSADITPLGVMAFHVPCSFLLFFIDVQPFRVYDGMVGCDPQAIRTMLGHLAFPSCIEPYTFYDSRRGIPRIFLFLWVIS
jgi:hypothetical protein